MRAFVCPAMLLRKRRKLTLTFNSPKFDRSQVITFLTMATLLSCDGAPDFDRLLLTTTLFTYQLGE